MIVGKPAEMCTLRKRTGTENTLSRIDRSLAVYRQTFRRARALLFWRVGGMSLVVSGVMGLTVGLTVPRVPTLAAPLSGSLSLADLGGTLAGATFYGKADHNSSGRSISGVGDVNGDGLDDLFIGAYRANGAGFDRGESYLVYGQPGGSVLSGSLNLVDVGGVLAGATFYGIGNGDWSGRAVSGAGDVNRDGLDDLLIGAYRANGTGNDRGESYLVYGQPNVHPLSGSLHLADVGGTVPGATFKGLANDDRSGFSVSSAGDVNGDGLDDLLIGAAYADGAGTARGETYLVYGQPNVHPLSGSFHLTDVGGTVPGATFNGLANDDRSGFSVSSAGDVNGDGLDDLLIGAAYADGAGAARGETYLVYGQPNVHPLSGSLALADVGGAFAGATFYGVEDDDLSGRSVSNAGDVNGDGFDDLLIGALLAEPSGQSYLVYGQDQGSLLSGSLNLAEVGGTVMGAIFQGKPEDAGSGYSGIEVSSAGDVNGDGFADLIIGGGQAKVDNDYRGESYLIYGQPNENLLSGWLSLSDVGGSVAGATFHGTENDDSSGRSVSSAGDVNGDGLDDLLIGAYLADGAGTDRGATYLVYGRRGNDVRWIEPGNGLWDDKTNWLGLEGPGIGNNVLVQSPNGSLVSGPTATTQMASLTLGDRQGGTVNLEVDPAGALLIDQMLTVETDGRLSGRGTVTATGGIANQGEIELGSQGLQLAGGTFTNTGLVRGGGRIDNRLVNSAGGEVRVAAGQRMVLTNTGAHSNAAVMEVIGNAVQLAEIEFDGPLTNAASTGSMIASHATLRFHGGLINQGAMGISFGDIQSTRSYRQSSGGYDYHDR